MGISISTEYSDNFASQLACLMNQNNNTKISKFVMLLWSIWKAWNTKVWDKKYPPVDEVIHIAQFNLDQWIDAQSKILIPSIGVCHSMDGQENWTKQDDNTIKINVDTPLFDGANKYDFGYVVRDYTGTLLEAKV